MKVVFAEKKVPLYILFNFILGAVLGTILFYAQLNAQEIDKESIELSFNTKINWVDVFRLSYTNALWFISIFLAFRILPSSIFHPIITARGAVGAFSVSYIINFFGILEAAAAVIPQCFSILPSMLLFSCKIIQRRKNALLTGKEMFNIRRADIILTMLLSLLSAAVESLMFRLFCTYLL